ncbi:hypothetical protein [Streptomyces morookaense]|uniref:Uncharacterized protein n=1 Tax=Streptomyces morookaense TaxID=1970 RepID=A0A7Y7E9P5_STRMO|nr:hypothetical protein [Streptomyces morookaense]NVK81258.1 hypothetical protein [Streptomyces morookaense]
MSTEADAPPCPAAPMGAPPAVAGGGSRGSIPPYPARPPRHITGRTVAAAVCAVLGTGLIAGALAGSWLVDGPDAPSATEASYARGATRWQEVPVDRLFPPAVHSDAAGPGGAARDWTRLGVAPDGDCTGAFDPLLARALAPAGCRRLLRATYADATSTRVTTVGLLITDTGRAGMRALDHRFSDEHLDERTDLMPRPYAPAGTVAEHFGDAQRASWRITVLTDVPAVVYAVTGFADGRTGVPPQPAPEAVARGATTVAAQAGLGNDATALAAQLERGYREAARTPDGETP